VGWLLGQKCVRLGESLEEPGADLRRVQRANLYPTFQFDEDGKPRLAIAEVIRQFSGESEWANA